MDLPNWNMPVNSAQKRGRMMANSTRLLPARALLRLSLIELNGIEAAAGGASAPGAGENRRSNVLGAARVRILRTARVRRQEESGETRDPGIRGRVVIHGHRENA